MQEEKKLLEERQKRKDSILEARSKNKVPPAVNGDGK
jgi:hypothetical protein